MFRVSSAAAPGRPIYVVTRLTIACLYNLRSLESVVAVVNYAAHITFACSRILYFAFVRFGYRGIRHRQGADRITSILAVVAQAMGQEQEIGGCLSVLRSQ